MQSSLLGLSLVFVISFANAHKCYVCGPGSEEPFVVQGAATDIDSETIQSCSKFESTTSVSGLEMFIRECPKVRYRGCTTQIDGSTILRTCAMIQLNDCKRANGIDYCYCSGDLCNNRKADDIQQAQIGDIKKTKQTREYKQVVEMRRQNYPIPSDDEDIYEGSGGYSTTTKPRYSNSISITLGPVEQRLGSTPTDYEKPVGSTTVTLQMMPISRLIILITTFWLVTAQIFYWRAV